MMKFKKPRLSIRSKLWIAISGTAVAVIVTIWLLQVVYLEDYYLRYKENEFKGIVNNIITSISEKGIYGANDDLYSIASENVLCIEIDTPLGAPIVNYEGLNYNCYIHNTQQRRLAFVQRAIENTGKRVEATVGAEKSAKKFFISSSLNNTQVGAHSDYVVIVSIALAPIKEASSVIRQQLLWLSISIILASVAVAFWMSHGFTKNILKINRAAKEVAHGNLNVDVSVSTNDELFDLAESFAEMTREIAKVNILQKELVANISHDMRTPLTMIKGYAETIKDITGNEKETREHQLDIIISESNRLSNLVSNVMDLSLLQAGQSRFNMESFNITAKIQDILQGFELLEQTKGFEFRIDTDKQYVVIGDTARIEQVLYNLINNAINHIGEIKKIVVSLVQEGDDVIISVADTGKGIAKEDLPLIWDRYYKPYKKTEGKSVGTGLGLSIVKAILVNHQSRFGVMSTLNVGSTFWFSLKISKANENYLLTP